MPDPALQQDIFKITDDRTFRETALKVFYYQSAHNPVYRAYLAGLRVDPGGISELDQIPFLPVEFFRTHAVICDGVSADEVFESSGTAGTTPARHHVADLSLYRRSLTEAFQLFYGPPSDYCILALLPSYLERSGSSLVHMTDHLIRLTQHPDSGFYLDNLGALSTIIQKRNTDGQPTILVGVSFALLDLAEQYPRKVGGHITLMETGGMKGRRKELVRSELHQQLRTAFGAQSIHSEYGMTELLTQAYSRGEGLFRPPPWMRVLARDPNDPFSLIGSGQTGGLNIIDLANLHSCSFIATGDLGKVHGDESFEVLGRFDHSDLRGCNLLVS